jgi:hypothetical protein
MRTGFINSVVFDPFVPGLFILLISNSLSFESGCLTSVIRGRGSQGRCWKAERTALQKRQFPQGPRAKTILSSLRWKVEDYETLITPRSSVRNKYDSQWNLGARVTSLSAIIWKIDGVIVLGWILREGGFAKTDEG